MSEKPEKDFGESGGGSGRVRQIILVVVLLLVIAAGIYEYAVARPAYTGIQDKIKELSDKGDSANKTDEDIHAVLGMKPGSVEDLSERNTRVERYSISRGLPLLKFDMWVWYQKSKKIVSESTTEAEGVYEDAWMFSGFHAGNEFPESRLPAKKVVNSIDKNNVPTLRLGGGGGAAQPNRPYDQPTGDEDSEEEGSAEEGSGTEGSGTEDAGDEDAGDEDAGDEGSAEETSSEEGSGTEGSGDEGSAEEGSGEEESSTEEGGDESEESDG